MPKTKYDELVAASDRDYALFRKYEDECREFIRRLKEGLVAYLECPKEKVEWLQFTEDESEEQRHAKDIIKFASGLWMALYGDAFYGFRFRIIFDLEKIKLYLKVKKVDEYFIVLVGKDKHKIHKDKQEELDALIAHIFDITREYLETRLENFIREKPSLGFLALTPASGEG